MATEVTSSYRTQNFSFARLCLHHMENIIRTFLKILFDADPHGTVPLATQTSVNREEILN